MAHAQSDRLPVIVDGNHYATLNGVGCAPPAANGSVPRAQQFTITKDTQRVSVDVRFDQQVTGKPASNPPLRVIFGPFRLTDGL